MTPYRFGLYVGQQLNKQANDITAPVPRSYSSMSTGNSTGVPPGGWTGKVRVPIRQPGSNKPMYGVNADVAAAANRAAGNPGAPNSNYTPTHILGPAPINDGYNNDSFSPADNINAVGAAEINKTPQPALTKNKGTAVFPQITPR
jgi:hypothetical protein